METQLSDNAVFLADSTKQLAEAEAEYASLTVQLANAVNKTDADDKEEDNTEQQEDPEQAHQQAIEAQQVANQEFQNSLQQQVLAMQQSFIKQFNEHVANTSINKEPDQDQKEFEFVQDDEVDPRVKVAQTKLAKANVAAAAAAR